MEREYAYEAALISFELAHQEFERKINKLYGLEGFDADGLTDIYPEMLDINSPEGNLRLKQWLKIVKSLQTQPKLAMIPRFTTKDLEYDTRNPRQGIDQMWVRAWEDLTPDAFVFVKADGDTPARAEIHAPTINLGNQVGLASVDSVILDIPEGKRSYQNMEEWMVPFHVTFADDWDELISEACKQEDKAKLFIGGIASVLIQYRASLGSEK